MKVDVPLTTRHPHPAAEFGKDRQFATPLIKAENLTKCDLVLFRQTAEGRNEEIDRYFFRV
jgi:hypothetical protein